MSRKLLFKKATRIEGNANIDIEISNGRIRTARFLIQEFRGFERFLRGRRVEHVPHLISRICGLCSCSHQVASLRAIENAMSLDVPSSVEYLREIIVLGEWISSHSLSYFFLSLPDVIGAAGGIFEFAAEHPEVSKDAFFLREGGLKISELLGKRAIHPVSMGIGHFLQPPTALDLDEVRSIARGVQARAAQLITTVGQSYCNPSAIAFPKDIQLNYLAFEPNGKKGTFKAFSREGQLREAFDVESFEESVAEIMTEWTQSKTPYLSHLGFPEGIMMVGPLSRSFLDSGFLADPEIQAFSLSSQLKERKMLSLESLDICRLLEIFWAAKRIISLLDQVDLKDTGVKPDFSINGQGFGVLEAPRGILVHSYLIRKGMLEKLRLLVATQFNNAYINLLIKDLSQKHLKGDTISPEGEHLIGRCVRLLDPCLSCATH
jgi:coenzyme F420-reducing hydrogenase alpha subunit